MVTNCLPLFYTRPDTNENKTVTRKASTHVKHELVRSSSTPAINEQVYDYTSDDASGIKHQKIQRQNSDVAVDSVSSPISAKLGTFERRRPMPKPRKANILHSRSEDNLVEACDEMYDTPYPYETVSITFNDSAEKIYRDNTSPPESGDLPPMPHTFELHFHSHSGWLVKLSKQKGWYCLCMCACV